MEARLDEAIKVLDSTVPKQIPKQILKGCKGIALVHASEFAIGVTGGTGSGVLVKRNEADGTWGAPAAIHFNFIGVGADFGVANKFVLIVPMTDEALKKLTEDDKINLGLDLGVAVGPGVEAEIGAAGVSPIYTYTFEKGLMVKGGIHGSVIGHEKEANKKFYGADKSPSEIVLEPGSVTLPEGNNYLDKFYQKLGSLDAK